MTTHALSLSLLPTEITIAGAVLERIDWTTGLPMALPETAMSTLGALEAEVTRHRQRHPRAAAEGKLDEEIVVYVLDPRGPRLNVTLVMGDAITFVVRAVIPGAALFGPLVDRHACATWQEVAIAIAELQVKHRENPRPAALAQRKAFADEFYENVQYANGK